MKKQTSIIVNANHHWEKGFSDNTKELDSFLNDGWIVINVTPMGGGYGGATNSSAIFASLVILEKDE